MSLVISLHLSIYLLDNTTQDTLGTGDIKIKRYSLSLSGIYSPVRETLEVSNDE
jgi:hypothetical protein